MTLWRLLVPPQLLLLVLVAPDRFSSTGRAMAVIVFLCIYSLIFAILTMRTRAGGSKLFHTADLTVVAALFLLCDTTTLLYEVVFYSEAVLLSWPTIRLGQLLPRIVALCLAYVTAENVLLVESNSVDYQVVSVMLFFLWGLSFFCFSHIIERVSALELDARLDAYRRRYRCRLHDDLGNTLCGLHYKIQSMRHAESSSQIMHSLDFLSHGYSRANGVMGRLVRGLQEPEVKLNKALEKMIAELRERDPGVEYSLELDRTHLNLSSQMEGEIFRIIREAANNALKHSGARRLSIRSVFDNDRIVFTVSDDGRGFDAGNESPSGASKDSFGIKGMRERAADIGGQFSIDSSPDSGASVRLVINAPRKAGRIGKIFNIETMGAKGGLYPFLVRVLLFVLIIDTIRALGSLTSSAHPVPLLIMIFLLTALCLGWIVFQHRVLLMLEKRPWLLIFLQVFYAGLFAGAWFYDVEPFFEYSFNFSVIISAYFVSIRNNFLLACLGGVLVTAATFAFPLDPSRYSWQMEITITNVASNIVFALTAGLAVEFVKSLENLQQGVVSRAMQRQRERLTTVTHRYLGALIHELGEDVRRLMERGEALDLATVQGIEERSSDVKKRLRKLLRSLDEAGDEATG